MNWIKFRDKNEKADFTHIRFHCYKVGEKYAMRVFVGWGDGKYPDLVRRKGGVIYRETEKAIDKNIMAWCESLGIKNE